MAARLCLGLAEAAVAPGCSLILGMWYKREEHALRHGYWYLGTSTGIVLSGLLSFGVAHVKEGLGAWKVCVSLQATILRQHQSNSDTTISGFSSHSLCSARPGLC